MTPRQAAFQLREIASLVDAGELEVVNIASNRGVLNTGYVTGEDGRAWATYSPADDWELTVSLLDINDGR